MGVFRFKRFMVDDDGCGMKICSDSVLLAAWLLPRLQHARSLLDAGTGSGVIALLAADIIPRANITAVEIDSDAALAASRNFDASPWPDRLSVVRNDYAAFISAQSQPFDIIISNPPYFASGIHAVDKARAAARHQLSLSYNVLLSHNKLTPDGILSFVSPADIEHHIIEAAEFARMKLQRLCRVSTVRGKAPSRLLWQFSRTDAAVQYSSLSIRNTDGAYSDEYRRLVEPYYYKL